jgi:hypothetical protein
LCHQPSSFIKEPAHHFELEFACLKPLLCFIKELMNIIHCYLSEASFTVSLAKIAFSFTKSWFNFESKSYLSAVKYLENYSTMLVKSFSFENLIFEKLIDYFDSYCLLLLRSNCENLCSHSFYYFLDLLIFAPFPSFFFGASLSFCLRSESSTLLINYYSEKP